MSWQEISVSEFNNLKDPLVIDVRSPYEHEQERILGSYNIPLLEDNERAEVGVIYKQLGEMVARCHALKLIAPKIPELIKQILTLRKHGQSIVVYCFRGGLRSEAVASLLSITGIDCLRLTGGYKAWRQEILQDFQHNKYNFTPIILHGLTGVGKTAILKALERQGEKVFDLEKLANHRGSVFGALGLSHQPTQKNFDASLWQVLRLLDNKVVFLEAEGRKLGQLWLPDCLFAHIQKGIAVKVINSLDNRAKTIAKEYLGNAESKKQVLLAGLESLNGLKERLGNKTLLHLKELVLKDEVIKAITVLLEEYYDPLYNKHMATISRFALEVSGHRPFYAAAQIATWAKTR